MKVIFLDIDGVLNSDQTPNPRKLPYVVDRKLLTRLKRVLKRTGAKVVLSSTWRYDPAGLFSAKYHGIPFIGVTPDMPHRPGATKFLAGSRNIQRSTGSPCLMTTTMNSTSCLFQPSAATGLTEDIANVLFVISTAKQTTTCARTTSSGCLKTRALSSKVTKGSDARPA